MRCKTIAAVIVMCLVVFQTPEAVAQIDLDPLGSEAEPTQNPVPAKSPSILAKPSFSMPRIPLPSVPHLPTRTPLHIQLPRPNLVQAWNNGAQRVKDQTMHVLDQTKHALTTPIITLPENGMTFWPVQTRSAAGKPKRFSLVPNWIKPAQPEIQKPETIADFLKQPRPE